MRNSIANGNGDSRYMKSAIPEDITHEELVALLREGAFPFDFNGINPDGFAQLGQGLTKENLLSDETEIFLWGNAADRTVNQALLKLCYAINAGDGMIINLTVVDEAGNPFPNVTVEGIYDAAANVIVTDENGRATGYTTATSADLTISGYFDLEETTLNVTGERGETKNVTFTVPYRNFLSMTTTQTKRFSPFCTRVDVTAVGGGGGGAAGQYARDRVGGGGAGGHVTVSESVPFTPETDYTAIVGAGGSKGSLAMYDSDVTAYKHSGKTGGQSSFLNVVANGGAGATGPSSTYQNTVATGNGNGGQSYFGLLYSPSDPTAGTEQGYISFTEMGPFGGGGASGHQYSTTRFSGASPYGAKGGAMEPYDDVEGGVSFSEYNATSPTGPGGGGGGGASMEVSDYQGSCSPSAGYRGVVNIRMYH